MPQIQSGEEVNADKATPVSELKPPTFFKDSGIRRSAGVALWWTLHAFVAAAFLRLALGDFDGGHLGAGEFQAAGMEQVLQFLGVPLTPWLALGLVFLAFFVSTLVVGSIWHFILHSLRIADLNSIAKEALQWAARRQLRVGWLAVALVCNGAMVFALTFSQHGDLTWAAFVFLLIVYGVPILILRPRWLGVSNDDLSWTPGIAALGAFVLLAMLDWVLAAACAALMGNLGGLLSFVPTLFVIWLTAIALLFVRSASDIRSHLASRISLRFLALVLLGTAQPVGIFVVWLLPPFLLALHYSIFIGPSVSHLVPYLPDSAGTAHRLFSSFANLFSDYWWIASIPLITVVWNLYVGRCLVVLESRDHKTTPRDKVFNTFP